MLALIVNLSNGLTQYANYYVQVLTDYTALDLAGVKGDVAQRYSLSPADVVIVNWTEISEEQHNNCIRQVRDNL
jgi:hypothetical protein